MKCCIIDASVAIKWYLPEPDSEKAMAVLQSVKEGGIAAPDLIFLEVENTLWKHVRRNDLPAREAIAVAEAIHHVGLLLLSTQEIASHALKIALAVGCTVYDAAYLASAVILDRPLLTADGKLRNLTAEGPFAGIVKTLDVWSSV